LSRLGARRFLASLVLATGCTVGPDYQRPQVKMTDAFRDQVKPQEAKSFADLPWWEVFQDEVLTNLIVEALQNNYDMRIAAARVEQARAQAGITAAQAYPAIGAGLGANYSRGLVAPGQTAPPLGSLTPQQRGLNRALDDQQQPVRFERLFDEVVGADFDRLDCRLDRAMPADHDNRHRRHLGVQQPENFDPVELAALQPNVEDDEGRLPGMDHGQRLGAVTGLARPVTLVLQHTRDQHADVGFVVDDQDVMRHVRPHSSPTAHRRRPHVRPCVPPWRRRA